MDRLFVMHHMPKLHEFIHYRIIDVTSVALLSDRWNENLSK